jgi:hypothetical protein
MANDGGDARVATGVAASTRRLPMNSQRPPPHPSLSEERGRRSVDEHAAAQNMPLSPPMPLWPTSQMRHLASDRAAVGAALRRAGTSTSTLTLLAQQGGRDFAAASHDPMAVDAGLSNNHPNIESMEMVPTSHVFDVGARETQSQQQQPAMETAPGLYPQQQRVIVVPYGFHAAPGQPQSSGQHPKPKCPVSSGLVVRNYVPWAWQLQQQTQPANSSSLPSHCGSQLQQVHLQFAAASRSYAPEIPQTNACGSSLPQQEAGAAPSRTYNHDHINRG